MYKVIVADSSPSVRKAVELAFPEAEFELFFFDNGQELAGALPDIGPDALLLSLSLPGVDGYRTAAHLRGLNEFRRASIFFLRGSFETFDADKASGLDYEEVVRKPFDSEALARRLKSALDRKHDILSFPAAAPDSENAPGMPPGPGLSDMVRAEVEKACAGMEKKVRESVLKELAGHRAEEKKTVRRRTNKKP